MDRIVLSRDEISINRILRSHEAFVGCANRILELANAELPITFGLDAEFLIEMFKGNVKIGNGSSGYFRYKRMIVEEELRHRFGGKDLEVDMDKAMGIFNFPEMSRELHNCLAECFNGIHKGGVQIGYLLTKDNQIVFTEEAIEAIVRKYTRELIGDNVKLYRRFEDVASQLNQLIEEVYGNQTSQLDIDSFLDFKPDGNGYFKVNAEYTAVPSERAYRQGMIRNVFGR